jgi:serine/threonine protein kinase
MFVANLFNFLGNQILYEGTDRSVYIRSLIIRFVFIALELSPASLYDVIEGRNEEMTTLRNLIPPKQILHEIMLGIRHLHSLKIVHRDIKPQNILFSSSSKPRILISDFGLCKKLSDDQSSFHNTNAGGTMGISILSINYLGWRAPECIELSGAKDSSAGDSSTAGNSSNSGDSSFGRVSKRIDIFSAGCVFHYVLSFGVHPYGEKYSRESNILKVSV